VPSQDEGPSLPLIGFLVEHKGEHIVLWPSTAVRLDLSASLLTRIQTLGSL
jgi:hypothetical protein